MAGIIEFLEARIAEDEAAAKEGLESREPARAAVGCFDPSRVLLESTAKRMILGNVPLVTDVPTAIGGTSEYVLMCLASVYSTHPDYQEGWIVDGM